MKEPIDLDELYLLASRATPGPWWIDSHGTEMVNPQTLDTVFAVDCRGKAVRHEDTGNLSHWRNDNDATFIAAANPTVVMHLIDRLRTAQSDFVQDILNEPEFPGELPREMRDHILACVADGDVGMAEFMRMIVKITKEGILMRLLERTGHQEHGDRPLTPNDVGGPTHA